MKKLKKIKAAEVKDLKRGIKVMQEKCKLRLNGRILVYIGEHGQTEYEVVEISHFHVMSDMILKVRKVKYDK